MAEQHASWPEEYVLNPLTLEVQQFHPQAGAEQEHDTVAAVPLHLVPMRGSSCLPKGPLVCQVSGCGKDLTTEKGYYQRYRACKQHLGTMCLVVHGKMSRFCQQCGKFQELHEFDDNKRSCRARLAQHNARRRKRSPPRGSSSSSSRGPSSGMARLQPANSAPVQELAGLTEQLDHAVATTSQSGEGGDDRAMVTAANSGGAGAATVGVATSNGEAYALDRARSLPAFPMQPGLQPQVPSQVPSQVQQVGQLLPAAPPAMMPATASTIARFNSTGLQTECYPDLMDIDGLAPSNLPDLPTGGDEGGDEAALLLHQTWHSEAADLYDPASTCADQLVGMDLLAPSSPSKPAGLLPGAEPMAAPGLVGLQSVLSSSRVGASVMPDMLGTYASAGSATTGLHTSTGSNNSTMLGMTRLAPVLSAPAQQLAGRDAGVRPSCQPAMTAQLLSRFGLPDLQASEDNQLWSSNSTLHSTRSTVTGTRLVCTDMLMSGQASFDGSAQDSSHQPEVKREQDGQMLLQLQQQLLSSQQQPPQSGRQQQRPADPAAQQQLLAQQQQQLLAQQRQPAAEALQHAHKPHLQAQKQQQVQQQAQQQLQLLQQQQLQQAQQMPLPLLPQLPLTPQQQLQQVVLFQQQQLLLAQMVLAQQQQQAAGSSKGKQGQAQVPSLMTLPGALSSLAAPPTLPVPNAASHMPPNLWSASAASWGVSNPHMTLAAAVGANALDTSSGPTSAPGQLKLKPEAADMGLPGLPPSMTSLVLPSASRDQKAPANHTQAGASGNHQQVGSLLALVQQQQQQQGLTAYQTVESLVRVSMKIANCVPDQLPPDLLQRLNNVLEGSGSSVLHGSMRAGCTHVIVDVCMPRNCSPLRSLSMHTDYSTACSIVPVIKPGDLQSVLGDVLLFDKQDVLVQQDEVITAHYASATGMQPIKGSVGKAASAAIQAVLPVCVAYPVPSEAQEAKEPSVEDAEGVCGWCTHHLEFLVLGHNLDQPHLKLWARLQGGSYMVQQVQQLQPPSADLSQHPACSAGWYSTVLPTLWSLAAQRGANMSVWKVCVHVPLAIRAGTDLSGALCLLEAEVEGVLGTWHPVLLLPHKDASCHKVMAELSQLWLQSLGSQDVQSLRGLVADLGRVADFALWSCDCYAGVDISPAGSQPSAGHASLQQRLQLHVLRAFQAASQYCQMQPGLMHTSMWLANAALHLGTDLPVGTVDIPLTSHTTNNTSAPSDTAVDTAWKPAAAGCTEHQQGNAQVTPLDNNVSSLQVHCPSGSSQSTNSIDVLGHFKNVPQAGTHGHEGYEGCLGKYIALTGCRPLGTSNRVAWAAAPVGSIRCS